MKLKKFFKGVRGKQILVSALALMVIVSGFVRWASVSKKTTEPLSAEILPIEDVAIETSGDGELVEETDYFALTRYERDCARSEAVEILSVSAESDKSELLAKQIEKHARNAANETAIENMVMSKGYADCVAFVDDSGVKVIVKAEQLDKTGVAQIKDIVVEQTGVKSTEIRISNKN